MRNKQLYLILSSTFNDTHFQATYTDDQEYIENILGHWGYRVFKFPQMCEISATEKE